MPLRLILLRHAKSSWDDPTLEDHARPLNKRGRKAATAVGLWLAANGHVPDQVLSSDSARTQETWERMSRELPISVPVTWHRGLYHASPQSILSILKRVGSASTILVLGHNPGIAEAAERIARNVPVHPKFAQYPTAAVTVYSIPIDDWSAMTWKSGVVESFVVPRELNTS